MRSHRLTGPSLLLAWVLGVSSGTNVGVAQDVSCDEFLYCDESTVPCDAMDEGGCDTACPPMTCRERWAESGISFQSNLTQFYFGTVDGGLEQTDRYSGHGDYVANFDLGKLGVHQGLFLKVRAEHRIGRAITEPTGALLPATLAAELPTTDDRDLHITNFVLTQALSESFIVFAGKVDSLDGDVNEFAHGRGITQFSNTAFIANPIALRTVPYASLGAGFAYLVEGEPRLSFLVINPTDTATSSGFDELFNDGVAISTELRFPTNFAQRRGHVLLGATYSTREFVSLDQDPRIILPQVPIARASDSWSFYYNTDHYLWEDPCSPGRGWGYFTRAGLADDETNPVEYFWSVGIGGSSLVSGRPQDSFGIGYYSLDTSSAIGPVLSAVLGTVGDSEGVEAFYNIKATDNLTITPDFQWISQARQSIDDAYVLGVRANLAF